MTSSGLAQAPISPLVSAQAIRDGEPCRVDRVAGAAQAAAALRARVPLA